MKVYNEEQVKKMLVEFGNYLYSDTRKKSFAIKSSRKSVPMDERLSQVTDADLENFWGNVPETFTACKLCFNGIIQKIRSIFGR